MRLILSCTCVLVSVLGNCAGNDGTLTKTLDALTKGLDYMQRKVYEINLDAVFCVRQVQEQLESYLANQPEVFLDIRHQIEELRDKAKKVADEGLPNVSIMNPEYAAPDVGLMAKESKKLAWYPSQETSPEYVVDPVNCSVYYYDYATENECYHHLIGAAGKLCDVDSSCYEFNEKYNDRSYGLTHQVLFWQIMETHECLDRVLADRRMRFCSNVMRDSTQIAAAHFPEQNEDIFMEQVGLCGFWGFKDFNQPEWLEKILEWQQESGCYKGQETEYCFDSILEETHRRIKRTELLLDDGCYSHNTAVALLALVVNVRFEAEKLYQRTAENLADSHKFYFM